MLRYPPAFWPPVFSDNLRRSRERMEKELSDAMADGQIDPGEAGNLDDVRKEMGLTKEQFFEIKNRVIEQESKSTLQSSVHDICPHCGK